jgi:hypothetical protein
MFDEAAVSGAPVGAGSGGAVLAAGGAVVDGGVAALPAASRRLHAENPKMRLNAVAVGAQE